MACEAFLFRKGAGAKGALIEIVMLKGGGGGPPPPPPPGHTGGYLHAPSGGSSEVIELYADNGTEARYWMAGLGVAVQSNGGGRRCDINKISSRMVKRHTQAGTGLAICPAE